MIYLFESIHFRNEKVAHEETKSQVEELTQVLAQSVKEYEAKIQELEEQRQQVHTFMKNVTK